MDDRALKMKTSDLRLEKERVERLLHPMFFTVIFRGKPPTKEYKNFRPNWQPAQYSFGNTIGLAFRCVA